MAQVGDVLITARADVGQAKQAFRSLQADVKQASADFKAGVISVGDYRTALSTARQEAIALRAGGLAPASRELNAFNQVMVATGPRLEGARRGLGTVRGAMVGLAASTIGVRGPLAALTSGLLLFGTGSAVGTGIAVGIAALAFAFSKITEKAREARQETKQYADFLRSLPEFQRPEIAADLATQRARQASINQQLEPLLAAQRQAKELGVSVPALDKQIEELQAAFIKVGQAIAGASRQLADLDDKLDKTSDGVRAVALELPKLASPDIADIFRDYAEHLQAQGDAVRDALDPIREYVRELERLRDLELQGAITGDERRQRVGQLANEFAPLPDVQAMMGKGAPWRQQVKQEFDQLGIDAAGSFVRGFVRSAFEGFKGFGNVLKNIFASLFEDALIQALRRMGGGGGGGGGLFGFLFNTALGFATGGPPGAAVGAASGAGRTFTQDAGPRGPFFSVNVGAPRSPTDMARDATWQAALRESMLIAESQGFRLVRV